MIDKVQLILDYNKLLDLINIYKIQLPYFFTYNNDYRLLCSYTYLSQIRDILLDVKNSYNYSHYDFFIKKDIDTILSLIEDNVLFKGE